MRTRRSPRNQTILWKYLGTTEPATGERIAPKPRKKVASKLMSKAEARRIMLGGRPTPATTE